MLAAMPIALRNMDVSSNEFRRIEPRITFNWASPVSHLAPAQKTPSLLEQVHVLSFSGARRARRDQLRGIPLRSISGRDVLVEQEEFTVEKVEVDWLLLQARQLAHLEKVRKLFDQAVLMRGNASSDDLVHGSWVGET